MDGIHCTNTAEYRPTFPYAEAKSALAYPALHLARRWVLRGYCVRAAGEASGVLRWPCVAWPHSRRTVDAAGWKHVRGVHIDAVRGLTVRDLFCAR
jgi:hypothetical protein